MIPVECMAAGRPVIGLYDGALKESLIGLKPWDSLNSVDASEASGVFIRKSRTSPVHALIESIGYFIDREEEFDHRVCIAQAEKFSVERFIDSWNAFAEANLPSTGGAPLGRAGQVANI